MRAVLKESTHVIQKIEVLMAGLLSGPCTIHHVTRQFYVFVTNIYICSSIQDPVPNVKLYPTQTVHTIAKTNYTHTHTFLKLSKASHKDSNNHI